MAVIDLFAQCSKLQVCRPIRAPDTCKPNGAFLIRRYRLSLAGHGRTGLLGGRPRPPPFFVRYLFYVLGLGVFCFVLLFFLRVSLFRKTALDLCGSSCIRLSTTPSTYVFGPAQHPAPIATCCHPVSWKNRGWLSLWSPPVLNSHSSKTIHFKNNSFQN